MPAVRAAADDDLPAITAIYAHWVAHGVASFELTPPNEAEMARRRRALLDSGYPYLVADGDERLLGYAYAGPYRARPAYRYTVESAVYVAPGVQRKGTGRALMQALIAACEAHGYRQMLAVIGDSANGASIGLHRALGFDIAGTLRSVGYKHGRWLDTVLMQRTLADGDTQPPAA